MAGKMQQIPTTMDTDGIPVARTFTSSTSDKANVECKAPPRTVVPIVFVPGIMGSNLRNKHNKRSVWNVNSKTALAKQWAFRWAETRQKRLNYTDCELDESGAFPGPSATVPDAKTAHRRGWGGPAKFSYGEFLRWLDDRLNADLCGSADLGTEGSPWTRYEDDRTWGHTWNAERPFQVLTKQESDYAWSSFFCPVHAVGYNWLQSNGESGKKLAQRIAEIIKEWTEFEINGRKPYQCEKVILVSHSMGGLVARAAVHPKYGNAEDKVLGIVHGELPANGAAAAYHHCRSGYNGLSSIILGRNASQVTAVFANSPGAMELLPNHQYPPGWLRATLGGSLAFSLPDTRTDPYTNVYLEKNRWWRLVDPLLIDPAGIYEKRKSDPWLQGYVPNLRSTRTYHYTLDTYYHPLTFIHYGADTKNHAAWNTLDWGSLMHPDNIRVPKNLLDYSIYNGSDPVTLSNPPYGGITFRISDPGSQPGDGTVPACSGEAPLAQGRSHVKQSFRLHGFEHQSSYDDEQVREATLYSIGKLLQEAELL